MKKLLILLCLSLLLTSCGTATEVQTAVGQAPQPVSELPESVPEPLPEPESSSETSWEPSEETLGEPLKEIPAVYVPDKDLTPHEIVAAYFEQQYLAYINFVDINLDSIIDTGRVVNRNMIRWHKLLIQRRRLLLENDLCYVETEKFPYTIEFDETPEDDRMERWKQWMVDTGESVIHFRIRGEEGKAYPPIMALNSQHSMFFKEIDGAWKIEMHYFPGSVRKFARSGTVRIPKEHDMLKQLEEEFALVSQPEEPNPPQGAAVYDAEKAVEYAMRYTENPNPAFYNIGDWVGNCANFISQCVWNGLYREAIDGVWSGDCMTSKWYGNDGGAPAWENVNHFWSYITSGKELGGQELDGVTALQNGDIIQTRSLTMDGDEDRYTHMLMVVDEDTLMLSQNSPGCFVYYSDLANVETRLVRPTYIIAAA